MKRTLISSAEKTTSNYKQQKPIYGAINAVEGPYYDPYDIHIHKWIKGPLKFPQNHREPVFDNSIADNSNVIKEYCSICHEINLDPTSKSLKISNINDIKYDNSKNIILQDLNNYNDYSKKLSYENGYQFQKKNDPSLEKIYKSTIFLQDSDEIFDSSNNFENEFIIILKDE